MITSVNGHGIKVTSSPDTPVIGHLKVGDLVSPKDPTYTLRSGGSYYQDAVVASLSPFILISTEGDMLWSTTVSPENFITTIGAVDTPTLEVVQRRLYRDFPELKPQPSTFPSKVTKAELF